MRIAAVVVTFHPEESFAENLRVLKEQVSNVVIIDNTENNVGLGAGLNAGIRQCDSEWILLMDQDSRIPEGYVEKMLECISPGIAVIGPHYIDSRTGMNLGPAPLSNGDLPFTMTSGSLLNMGVFREAGPFDESLFIDYVDTEYCLRLRKMGWRIVQSEAVLSHALGESLQAKLGSYERTSISHCAGRVYYITRNRMAVIRKYCVHFPLWALKETVVGLRAPIKIAMFESGKLEKLGMWLRGVWDATLFRSGYRAQL